MKALQLAVISCLTVLVCGQSIIRPLRTQHCYETLQEHQCAYRINCNSFVDICGWDRYRFRGNVTVLNDRDETEASFYCFPWDTIEWQNDNYHKIILTMDDPGSFDNINLFHDCWGGSIRDLIYSVDLSNKNLEYNPLSRYKVSLPNLGVMNFSENAFNTAELSGSVDMKLLIEIDYSHNTIINIENTQDDRYPYKNLKKINLSYNNLIAIPDAIFYNLVKLEYLDLSHNYIDTLTTLTFEGIRNLNVLKLSHNRISKINNSLLRFTKLEHVELNHNQNENIKTQDFEKLNQLKMLDLSFNSISAIEKNSFNNLIAVTQLLLNDNKLKVIDNDLFVTLTQLSYIDISNNLLKTIAQNSFKDKALSFFSVKGNHIEGKLVKGIFDGLSNVTEIDLSKQRLNSVDSFAFYGMIKLETLLLNDNIIQTVSKTAFKSLHNLNVLDLSNNHMADVVLDTEDLINLRSLLLKNNLLTHVRPEYFDGLNSLQYLDLSNNNISQLASSCFGSLGQLVNFQISNNPLSGALDSNTFDGLKSLPSLDISNTKFSIVKNGTFFGMSQLKMLNMSHSTIENLHFKSFMNTGAVELIDLSFNRLIVFEVDTSDLLQLNTLYLNNNFMQHVSPTSFKDLSLLIVINLAHNNISVIDDDAFVDQNNLQSLDFSFNRHAKINMSKIIRPATLKLSGISSNISFKDIPFSTSSVQDLVLSSAAIQNITNAEVRRLNTLGSLILNNNSISKVEVGAFSNMTVLKSIDLSYNKIDFIQPGVFKDCAMLNLLNISHNNIKTIGYGVFRGTTNLKIIDMAFNSIDNLQCERFYEIPQLTKLIADHNQIRFINLGDFSGTSLSVLSIGGNPIPCDMVVSLKNQEHLHISITAITLDEHSGENVDGIRCNIEDSKGIIRHSSQPNKVTENDKVLYEIRDAIYNISIVNHAETKPSKEDPIFSNNGIKHIGNTGEYVVKAIENVSHTIEGENKIFIEEMEKENNRTTLILQNILKTLAESNIVVRKPEPIPISKDMENSTAANMIPLTNRAKQDFNDTDEDLKKKNMIAQMKQNLEMMEHKISLLNQTMSQFIDSPIYKHDALIKNDSKQERTSETKSFVFMETCVALILLILVVFILYKFYNSGMFIPSRRTQSTRNLPDEENSAL